MPMAAESGREGEWGNGRSFVLCNLRGGLGVGKFWDRPQAYPTQETRRGSLVSGREGKDQAAAMKCRACSRSALFESCEAEVEFGQAQQAVAVGVPGGEKLIDSRGDAWRQTEFAEFSGR